MTDVLGIASRIRDATSENQQEQCMDDDIHTWLRRAHDEKKHGPPTWKKLVEAIADPIGGQDPAYAEDIAKEHPSEYKYSRTISSLQVRVGFYSSEQRANVESDAEATVTAPRQTTENDPGKNIICIFFYYSGKIKHINS